MTDFVCSQCNDSYPYSTKKFFPTVLGDECANCKFAICKNCILKKDNFYYVKACGYCDHNVCRNCERQCEHCGTEHCINCLELERDCPSTIYLKEYYRN